MIEQGALIVDNSAINRPLIQKLCRAITKNIMKNNIC